MSKRISHIAPWQAGKLFAVVYFFMSLIFVIPMIYINANSPAAKGGPGPHFGIWFFVLLPFLYALIGLILVPLGCWVYNMAAKVVGGLQVTVTDDADV